jgi:hypothetical protein
MLPFVRARSGSDLSFALHETHSDGPGLSKSISGRLAVKDSPKPPMSRENALYSWLKVCKFQGQSDGAHRLSKLRSHLFA